MVTAKVINIFGIFGRDAAFGLDVKEEAEDVILEGDDDADADADNADNANDEVEDGIDKDAGLDNKEEDEKDKVRDTALEIEEDVLLAERSRIQFAPGRHRAFATSHSVFFSHNQIVNILYKMMYHI